MTYLSYIWIKAIIFHVCVYTFCKQSIFDQSQGSPGNVEGLKFNFSLWGLLETIQMYLFKNINVDDTVESIYSLCAFLKTSR